MKLKRILLNNSGLKLLTKEVTEKTVLQKILASQYDTKSLYIKPIFVGKVPEGYEFLEDKVKITPEHIIVVGPSNILSKREFIYTNPIDLSEHARTKTLDVRLDRISPTIKLQNVEARIYLPIKTMGKKSHKE